MRESHEDGIASIPCSLGRVSTMCSLETPPRLPLYVYAKLTLCRMVTMFDATLRRSHGHDLAWIPCSLVMASLKVGLKNASVFERTLEAAKSVPRVD